MSQKIITIGYELPGHSDLYYSYTSNQSLLDADIVLFQPDFSNYRLDNSGYDGSYFQGKRCYSKDDSFNLKEDTTHWKSELTTAAENGKTVIVFLSNYQECYVHTGKNTVSGTGRNAKTTNMVESYNSFAFFPVTLPSIVPKTGKEILFCNNSVFSTIYNEFKEQFSYEAYISKKLPNAIFLTRTGEMTLGALFKIGKGNLVLLPPIPYSKSKFIKYDKQDKPIWTKEAIQFGSRLLKEIVGIDKALRKEGERTPPPLWIETDAYTLNKESELRIDIDIINTEINNLLTRKTAKEEEVNEVVKLKDLLFEKGKNLENAVTAALVILGYTAENFNDGNLELDQIILSPEGDRFVGEVEGKDSSAVNIEKFRQLTVNIHEDLQREEVLEAAKGILFGNGFRLVAPNERNEQFTDKCISVAKSSNCCLIKTSDLFTVSKYIQQSNNKKYAKKCRDSIKASIGKIVVFPAIPAIEKAAAV